MATTAYPTPIILSCAKDFAPSFLPRFSFKFKTSKRSNNPFLLFSVASVGGPPLSGSAIKRRGRRGAKVVSCSFSNGPQAVTACQWNEYVICSDELVLVEFWASWCAPCGMVRRIIEEISEEYTERIKFYRIDAEDHPQIAASYGIDQVPTITLFKNGDKVESITGTLPISVYVKAIERYLS